MSVQLKLLKMKNEKKQSKEKGKFRLNNGNSRGFILSYKSVK